MKAFSNPEIARLGHELTLSPLRHRLRQVAGIIRLIDLIDPANEYPYSFICFHITGYRPRKTQDTLLEGEALVPDLVELLDGLTAAAPLPAAAADGPLYDVDALARRFSVSTRTICRWRRRGLAGCWYAGDDGRPRLAFTSHAVQRFIARHLDLVRHGAQFRHMTDDERRRIIARAREIVASRRCSLHVVTVCLAEETGRAVETLRYTLRRHDSEHPDQALFDRVDAPRPIDEAALIYDASSRGDSVAALAARFDRSETEIRRVIAGVRAARLAAEPIACVYNPAFDDADADARIHADPPAAAPEEETEATLARPPADLPPYLRALYDTPLLTRAEEMTLFRRMNYLLHKAELARQAFAGRPEAATPVQVSRVQDLLDQAGRIKNRIIQANLRLVVSIARRHLRTRPAANLFELVSDGNLVLMRAVEKFDYARGFRFSTYASWAIVRGFARSIPEELSHADRYRTGHDELLAGTRDHRIEPQADNPAEQPAVREALAAGLAALDERERRIIHARFGLGGQPAARSLEEVAGQLGLSKERVRQIERAALGKLRAALAGPPAALLAG
jgi:RNA polymerase sigma factor (sigma-70 family)